MDDTVKPELEDLAAEAAAIEGEFIPAGEGPAGGEPDPEAIKKSFEDLANALLTQVITAVSYRFAPRWFGDELPKEIRITPKRFEDLQPLHSALIDKWLGALFSEFPLEAAVAAGWLAIWIPAALSGVPAKHTPPKDAHTDAPQTDDNDAGASG